jgi:hypothetical protein
LNGRNKKSQVTVLGKKGYERKGTKISPLTFGYGLCYDSRPEKETQGGNSVKNTKLSGMFFISICAVAARHGD